MSEMKRHGREYLDGWSRAAKAIRVFGQAPVLSAHERRVDTAFVHGYLDACRVSVGEGA